MKVSMRSRVGWNVIRDGLTLPERARLYRATPGCFTADVTRAERILAHWGDLMGRDLETGVDDRLEDLNLQAVDLPKIVGDIDPSAASYLPDAIWMEVCGEVLSWEGPNDEHGIPTATFLSGAGEAKIPFEHALVAWVEVATERLRIRRPEIDDELPVEVLRSEQRGLMEGLAIFARDSNVDDFSRARVGAYDGNDFAMGMLMAEPPCDVYRRVIRGMTGSAMADWMGRYPALARLLAMRVESWARAMGELLARVDMDRDLIARVFNQGDDPGMLTEARLGRGDSHNGGRSVAMLRFADGLRLVYKPRSLSIDQSSRSLFAVMNDGLDPSFRIELPNCVDRGRYGWSEFIEPGPCADQREVETFHRRMGVLLGMVHLLQGNDFHLENVIAHGDMPVPIDLETISVPSAIIRTESDDFEDPAAEVIASSVLGTLLLPAAMSIGNQRDLRQFGALRVEMPGALQIRKIQKLIQVNTDFQRWVKVPDDTRTRPNSEPWIDGEDLIDAAEYQDETIEGYRHFHEASRNRKPAILEALAVLEDAWVRILNRATNVYFRLLLESCDSSLMRSGIDRWIHLQRLFLSISPSETEESARSLSSVANAEVDALFDGDIAYFTTRGGGKKYFTIESVSGDQIELPGSLLGKSARDCVIDQIDRMTPEDMELQISLQGDAYRSTFISLSSLMHGVADGTAPGEDDPDTEIDASEAELRRLLTSSLGSLADSRLMSGDLASWIGLDMDSVREVVTPTALSCDLYSGRGGLAVLFEKAYRVLGDHRWLELARSALEIELAGYRRHGDDSPLLQCPPDGVGVRAGAIAGLWTIGRHEGMGDCRDLARRLATKISERVVRRDETYDLISGSSGMILLLLGLDEEETIPGVLEVVGRLADHLVAHQVDDSGPSWNAFKGERSVCGIGHGRSGSGLALLAAGAKLDRVDLRRLGLAVLHGEHSLRCDSPEDAWPDFRGVRRGSTETPPSGSTAWCNGTEGIALARAAALRIVDDPILRDDLEFALVGANQMPTTKRFHLCCGRAGRVETLGSLKRLLPEIDLIDPVLAARAMVRAIDDPGSNFGLHGPGLFQGRAGAIWAGLSLLDSEDSDLLLLRV
ncbi:MAG: hypothetical protein CMJ23_04080 [Phycisphaerae bacterium]|nr:hypothetical protein [Phycisphaerae bacterium]